MTVPEVDAFLTGEDGFFDVPELPAGTWCVVRAERALSVEQRLRWSNVGFLIIVGIMLWALSNDFLRLLGL